MAKSSSGILVTFGIVNIFICLLAACCKLRWHDFSHQRTDARHDREPRRWPAVSPTHEPRRAQCEVRGDRCLVCNSFFSMLLIVGSVGLFSAGNWARWMTIRRRSC